MTPHVSKWWRARNTILKANPSVQQVGITIKLVILQQFHTGRTRVGVNTAHCMEYCSTVLLNRSSLKPRIETVLIYCLEVVNK